MAGSNAPTRRTVIHDREFQISDRGYLVDNLSWQDEIKKRAADLKNWSAPEFQAVVETEGPSVEAASLEPVDVDPKVAYAEALEKARVDASDLMERILREARVKAEADAEALRISAKAEIEKMKSDAEVQVREAKEQALKQAEQAGRLQGLEAGKAEGLNLGKVEGLKEYQSKIMAWDAMFRTASEQRHAAVADLEGLLVDLVGDALHRCLQNEAKTRPAMVLDMVRSVLQKAHDRSKLRIHLNPEDVQRVQQAKAQLQLSVGAGELELVPDNRVEKGGCLLETEAGSVDAQLGTMASQAQEALKSGM
jgi:flagellar assembly protein FliH